jgi:hypothetical protein
MVADAGQRASGGISRRSALRAGLLAGAGVATAGAMSTVLTGTAQASTPEPQPDWGWCEYCATMWWTPNRGDSACAAPNQGHHSVRSGAYNYEMYNNLGGLNNNTNPQANWRWCTACQGMFWAPSGHNVCQAITPGNRHIAGSGTNYDLYFDLMIKGTSPQPYWRWCGQCGLLYWQGSSGTYGGYCPGSELVPGPHVAGSATSYCINWSGTY